MIIRDMEMNSGVSTQRRWKMCLALRCQFLYLALLASHSPMPASGYRFDANDFQVLRLLLKLVDSSPEARTVAVGCSDLGMFITHHAQGRYIVNGLRGKVCVLCVCACVPFHELCT